MRWRNARMGQFSQVIISSIYSFQLLFLKDKPKMKNDELADLLLGIKPHKEKNSRIQPHNCLQRTISWTNTKLFAPKQLKFV